MATQRLSQSDKRKIARQMTAYAFDRRIEDAEALVGTCLYEARMVGERTVLPPSLLKDGWIPTAETADIRVQHKDWGNETYASYNIKFPKPLPVKVTESARYSGTVYATVRLDLDNQSPEAMAARALRALGKKRETYESEVASVLNSVQTVKQLLELLPEAKDFLPEAKAEVHALVDSALLARVKRGIQAATA